MTPDEMMNLLTPQGGQQPPAAAPAVAPAAAPPSVDPQFPRPAGYGPPATAPTNPEAAAGGYTGWLKDPANRAFMMQMGIQLMTPTWGGPMANIAAGIGAGAEAASGTAKAIGDEQAAFDKLQGENTRSALDRQGRENVARIGAEGRVQVAEIRGAHSLQRAAAAGAKSPNELAAYNSVYNTTYRALESNNVLKPPGQQLTQQQMMDQAAMAADAQYARYRTRPGQNAPGGADNSVVPPAASPTGGSQGPPASPPTGQNRSPPSGTQPGLIRRMLEQSGNMGGGLVPEDAPVGPGGAGEPPGLGPTPVRPAAAAPAARAQDPAAPPIGTVVGHTAGQFKYIGGPRNNPTSWQKVQ